MSSDMGSSDMGRRVARLGVVFFAAQPVDVQSADALEQHFHQVVVDRGVSGTPVIANVALTPLTSLAEELGRTVTPMQPPSRFRQDLGMALTDAHRQRMAQRALGTVASPRPRRQTSPSRLLWAGGIVALVMLWLWRRRTSARE